MDGEERIGDGDVALVAHSIPVEGVALRVQGQRAVHGVTDHIAVFAARERHILFADTKLRISPTLALLIPHRATVCGDLQDFYADSIVAFVLADILRIPAILRSDRQVAHKSPAVKFAG